MNLAILLAAGRSQRAGRNKLWTDVHGRKLWTLSYETLSEHPDIDEVVLVVPPGEEEKFKSISLNENTRVVSGGSSRMESFKAGLSGLDLGSGDVVIDHNAANPNVTDEEISQVISVAREHGAAAVSLPSVDTVFISDGDHYVELLDRDKIRLMQTPQACRGDVLAKAALKNEADLTSAIMEVTKVKIVDGDWANQKITFAQDISNLVGHAYMGEDSHKFSSKGNLKLGGLVIDNLPAMVANSDGDVILHAIGRALSQAHDSSFAELADRMCKEGKLDSAQYLIPLMKGVEIHNVSIQIEALRPNIRDINISLKKSISNILKISPNKVRISAMTGENLTAFGKGEGIKCTCILTCKSSKQ